MGKRVAVIGASGFVGSAFVEAALEERQIEVVAVIHSSGNAWRLIRHGIELRSVNLLDKASVAAAVTGCSHVVNCSRGGSDVMLTGLHNLLDCSARAGVNGFVHLSSVLVYGDPPSPDSASESGTIPRLDRASYGGMKLQQDRLVQRAAASGLPALILCPPNITGPYSHFLSAIVAALRHGALALLEGGETVCNLVDVDNLVHAIALGLDHCTGKAPRLFVTDDEGVTWRRIVEAVLPLCVDAPLPPSIERMELARLRHSLHPVQRISVLGSLKHLVSSDVRAAMRKDPLWAKIDGALRLAAARLGSGFEERMRHALEGPVRVARESEFQMVNIALSSQQLRGVRHSCAQAKAIIGYLPIRAFTESMQAYRAWYRSHTGQNSPSWSLAQYLWK